MSISGRVKTLEKKMKAIIEMPEIIIIDDIDENEDEWGVLYVPSGKIETYEELLKRE